MWGGGQMPPGGRPVWCPWPLDAVWSSGGHLTILSVFVGKPEVSFRSHPIALKHFQRVSWCHMRLCMARCTSEWQPGTPTACNLGLQAANGPSPQLVTAPALPSHSIVFIQKCSHDCVSTQSTNSLAEHQIQNTICSSNYILQFVIKMGKLDLWLPLILRRIMAVELQDTGIKIISQMDYPWMPSNGVRRKTELCYALRTSVGTASEERWIIIQIMHWCYRMGRKTVKRGCIGGRGWAVVNEKINNGIQHVHHWSSF